MKSFVRPGSRFVWPTIVAAGGFILGLVLLCIAPFAAVAAVAARTMPLRIAIATVAAMWLGGQVAGFAFYHYPHEFSTYALGLAIGVSGIAAAAVASRIKILPFAFLAAFAVFEIVQYAFSLAFGGSDTFTFAIVLEILEGNVLGLAILWALRLVAGAAGILPVARSLPRGARET